MLSHTIGSVLDATVDQVAFKLIEMLDNQNDSPPPNLVIERPKSIDVRSGTKRRRQSVNKTLRTNYSSIQR